jgi:hypothetical protein
MPLIVAIEPDSPQAALVAALSPRHLDAEIVVVASAEAALRVIDARVPDLLLTPPLLAARDDAALTARVRELDDHGIQVPVLVIPVLASDDEVNGPEADRPAGLLTRMRKPKAVARISKGCAPGVFARQIQEYLARAAAERHDREESARQIASVHTSAATAPLLAELLPLGSTVVLDARDDAAMPLEMPRDIAVHPPLVAPADLADAPADDTLAWPHIELEVATAPIVADAAPVAPTVEDVVPVAPIAVDVVPVAPLAVDVVQAEPHAEDVALVAPVVPDRPPAFSEAVAIETVAEPAVTDELAAGAHEPWAAPVDIAGSTDLDGTPASEVLSITEASAADDEAMEERDRVDRVDADELWTPLPPVHVQAAPIEGPALRRTRLPKPAKLSKARPRRVREKTAPSAPRETRPTHAPPAAETSKPLQDEWGLYDPEQCGFAALLDRLEEITAAAAPDRKRARRSAIMRR